MTPGQRAFFAGLAFSRAKSAKIDKVFSRFEYKLYRFDIHIDAEGNVQGFDPASQSVVRGKLPLVQFMKNARHFSFEGERDIFQGMDLKEMTQFRIDVYPFWCRFHDIHANAFFYYLLERQPGDEAGDWLAMEEQAASRSGTEGSAKSSRPKKAGSPGKPAKPKKARPAKPKAALKPKPGLKPKKTP